MRTSHLNQRPPLQLKINTKARKVQTKIVKQYPYKKCWQANQIQIRETSTMLIFFGEKIQQNYPLTLILVRLLFIQSRITLIQIHEFGMGTSLCKAGIMHNNNLIAVSN